MTNYDADRNQFSARLTVAQTLMDAGVLSDGFDVLRAIHIEDGAYVAEVLRESTIDGFTHEDWVVWDVVEGEGAYIGSYFDTEAEARSEFFNRADRRAR